QLEVHSLCRSRAGAAAPLVVYFFVYEGSRSSGYLTQLRKEKEAFEFLIRERSVAGGDERAGCQGRPGASGGTGGTRRWDCRGAAEQHQRAALPAAQARHHHPAGDHRRRRLRADARHLRLERKSVSDLIGSLNSGRLYNQVVNMTQHYRSPVLLIEFDAERTGFALYHGRAAMSSELNSSDTISRLSLLTLHFPQLRILWSPAPHASAELFPRPQAGPPAAAAAAAALSLGRHRRRLLQRRRRQRGFFVDFVDAGGLGGDAA
uniref:ERCC4 domain-containing protein n=1 Tax=Macrostomum lignano TaxID=282301 RepID=A0A1I8F9X0_9PLAT